ncbi:MAG: serine/threonine protein kinase [Planctomycetes bacterium]|nr:serine/threonine protein kinase [Planctomycetota bacterium]
MSRGSSKGRELTAAQFARVREVFNRAYGLGAEDRRALLAEACGGDAAVLAAAEELLASADVAGEELAPEGGLVGRVLSAEGSGAALPGQIGPYRIERLIGRGGMGLVYLATQRSPDREVALKILRGGLGAGSASLDSRFSREIRVLGRLEHPGIARIYDAGEAATASGSVSYFAMEYIRGPRLDEYVRTKEPTPAARLELVARIADAVQHAHTRGVIHRDLKPSNILIDEASGEGGDSRAGAAGVQPKILDFGVARLLEPDGQQTALTEQGLVVGTIAYMSPEQLAGDPEAIDMRTDVYAIGVMLFELLAGRLPYDVLTKSIAEAARIIRDDEPAPMRSAAGVRIDRDLATIVGKAMAKNKEERYATAAALAEDIRRYVRNEPILARSPTVAYQLAKFARRNRGLVVASGAAVLAAIAGLIVGTVLFIGAQRARERAAKEAELSLAVRGYMINGLLMAAAPERMGYEVKMMDVLTHAAEGLHERFAELPEVEAEVRCDLARVLMKLGKPKESFAQLELAVPLLEKTGGKDDGKTIEALSIMADAARGVQDHEGSLRIGEDAMARARRVLAPGDPVLVGVINVLGATYSMVGRHDEAIALLREGISQAERAPAHDDFTMMSMLTWLQSSEMAKGDMAAALEITRQLAERSQKVYGPDHESSLSARSNLMNLLSKSGRIDEAAAIATGLPEAAERTFPPGHPARAFSAVSAADAMRQAKRFEEAERYGMKGYEACVATFDDLNWATEQAVKILRMTYADWPGHGEQWKRWALASARIRMMVAKVDELPTTLKLLERVAAEAKAAGVEAGPQGVLGMMWGEREALAPPKHPRRAAFFANLALAGVSMDQRGHGPEAIDLAAAALPDAHDKAVAEALIAAAKAK